MGLFIKFRTKKLFSPTLFHLTLHAFFCFFLLLNFSVALGGEDSQELKNNFSTPQQTLDALVEAVIKGDMTLYELILGRKLDELELEHIEAIKKTPGNKIVGIKPLVVLNREYRGKEKNKIFCITMDMQFNFANGKQNTRKFEPCFRKEAGRWYYLSQDIRLFQ